MTQTMLVAVLALIAALLAALGVVLWQITRQERLLSRIRMVQLSGGLAVERVDTSGPLPLRIIAAIGNTIARSGLLSTGTLTELETTLTSAGFRRGSGLGLFVGSKLLLLAALPSLAFLILNLLTLSSGTRYLGLGIAAVAGLLGPDFIVRSLRKRYLKAVDRGLPDALDLLVICSEAGLGLEPAIARVAVEIRHAHAAVADELQLTGNELRISSDARAALLQAGKRTGLESVKRLATTLVQTIQYGTPLSQALRTLAAEMRQDMLTRFEARAARLPVLLTVPMIVFILPCVFLVVGGPAMLQVMKVMHN